MRRRLAAILTMALVTGLVGCGEKETTETMKPEDTGTVVLTDAAGETEKETVTEEEDTETKKEPVVEECPVTITYSSANNDRALDDGTVILYATYSRPNIIIKGNENATAVIDAEIQTDEDAFYINTDELETEARSYYEEVAEDGMGYANYVEFFEKRVDCRVISLQRRNYSNRGGAHGGSFVSGLNFDVNTGKRLTLDDITEDREGFLSSVKEYLLGLCESEVYKDRLNPGYEENIDFILQDDLWYFDRVGLTFIANEYELAAYAEGTLRFTIPYGDLKGLKKEYAYEGGYQMTANLGQTLKIDIDGDGSKDEITFSATNMDNGDSEASLVINGEDFSNVFKENDFYFAYPHEQYVVCDIDSKDKTMELAFQDYGMSEDPMTAFIRYENGSVSYLGMICDRVTDGYIVNEGNGILKARERMSIFETVNIKESFEVSDGKLSVVPQDIYEVSYPYYNAEDSAKTVLQEITVYEKMNTDSNPIVLEKDAKVMVIGTDNREWVQIQKEDGQICYVHIIDGYMVDSAGEEISATEVFDSLFLAG